MGSFRVPQDPRVIEPGGLAGGQASVVQVVQRRGAGAETAATAQEEGREAVGGTVRSDGSKPGWESRLRRGSVARRQTVPIPDDYRCLYPRKRSHRSRQSLKEDDVVRTLNRLKQKRGVPTLLLCGKGSEFTSRAMDLWAYQNGSRPTLASRRPDGQRVHRIV